MQQESAHKISFCKAFPFLSQYLALSILGIGETALGLLVWERSFVVLCMGEEQSKSTLSGSLVSLSWELPAQLEAASPGPGRCWCHFNNNISVARGTLL